MLSLLQVAPVTWAALTAPRVMTSLASVCVRAGSGETSATGNSSEK